ncbi:hypothetical protein FT663_02658 [Candidozyma haemuli var. vulneris]|uniref:Inheritance of peroxisomes protein 1 n=1 Tax=Candidozyma haemuli TaxID=45357 RepID=A0A2V1ALY8_9ASCO|nr:hypothetical protein CXQ85_001613 [[Candida] haemuloni]KAF3988087.1 hypothetical protein FT662_03622 [[Candida] haemuloni var. vulneris]KAF3991576.1 hypothetical protein FT663_02658 [[Candida] haemuloni var. vulneris]PVH19307.1 hypothetical protein CXQ85_001613 [[Candida] haemuloni]
MITQDKSEDYKNRKQPNDRRKRRSKKKKKTNSAETPVDGQSPQKNVVNSKETSQEDGRSKDPAEEFKTLDPKTPNAEGSGVKKFPSLQTEGLVQPPPKSHEQPAMSPRKQTLLRHKKSSDQVSEPSFISEAKEFRKNRKQPPTHPTSSSEPNLEDDDHKYSMLLSQQNLQGKASLFRYQAARILVYHEQIQDPVSQSSSGTLLGHGELEIFQLHNGDVTYLACGRSFVYPLLPKLKILRISLNQFILPLSNPERYWKINIDTEDVDVIKELERILQKVVKYTNLSFAAAKTNELPSYIDSGIPEDVQQPEKPAAVAPDTPQTPEKSRQPNNVVQAPLLDGSALHAGHAERTPKASHFTPYFNDIPESPPSAPVSPQQLYEPDPAFQLPPVNEPQWPLHRQKSSQSITSALASFNLNEQAIAPKTKPTSKLFQPKPVSSPHRHANPHANPHATIHASKEIPYKQHSNPYHNRTRQAKAADAKSDSSSMDSLLDEYEENISTTKSINFNIPRSQSRTMSLASSAYPAAINYQRGKIPLVPDIRSNMGSVTHEAADEEEELDDFPKTSLSQYNKARQNTQSQKSRRSSPSELYNSVSNWMEPNVRQQPQLSHSRSNYSLASAKNSIASNRTQENTLRDIYRSITENNLHANLQQPNGRRQSIGSGRGYVPRPKTNALSSQTQQHKHYPSDNSMRRGDTYSQKANSARNGSRNGKEPLSSSDVYRLVSARSGRSESVNGEQSKRGGISRLFGW